MSEEFLEPDPLFIGLTRPATKLGIPIMFFMASLAISVVGFNLLIGFTQNLFLAVSGSLGAFIVINAYAFLMTLQDPFGLQIQWINMIHFRKQATCKFWNNTNSYFPW